MIKYSTIKQLFKDEELDLVQIHTPSKPKKSNKVLTSFFVKENGVTKRIEYHVKGNYITEEDVKEIVRLSKNG